MLALAASAMLPLAQAGPHDQRIAWGMLLAGGLCFCYRPARPLAWLLAPALATMFTIQSRLADRLPAQYAGQSLTVVGLIDSLPRRRDDQLEFLFRPDRRPDTPDWLPQLIRVRWYEQAPAVRAGETWQLGLRLQPPRDRVNFHGTDAERYYFARAIGAVATVTGEGRTLHAPDRWRLDRLRQDLGDRLRAMLADEPALGLILALAIADRSELSDLHWAQLSATGTGHLLAISGLHIGFAALLGFRLSWLLLPLAPLCWRLRLGFALPWCGAGLTALAYAAMAGFGISTRRALLMLAVLACAQLSRRHVHPVQGWALALILVLLFDAMAPLQAGFWLSFIAVLVLLVLFAPRTATRHRSARPVLAQAGIMLAMLPLGMYWFQNATALGFLANLFAIPAVSFVVVPLVLAGLLLISLGLDAMAEGFLLPASWAADGISRALGGLAGFGSDWIVQTHQPSLAGTMLATLGALLMLGPRGLPARWLAPILMLPLVVPVAPRLDEAGFRLSLLDVGQGLAALVETREEVIVYDTGPGQGGRWDLVGAVIAPALRQATHSAPSRILVSHGDLDHAGGLSTLSQAYPRAITWANTRRNSRHGSPCNSSIAFSGGGVDFRVLHPSSSLPYLGNASSCVLSMASAFHSVLLPGDINHAAEQRLLGQGLGPHDIVIAPHHGSKTSSSLEFIRATQPGWVLFPTGAGNRFGFPHEGVVQRYRSQGARVASVSDCGALQVDLLPGQAPRVRSARRVRNAIWRWPAATTCP
jgi:competence protein ComEC